MDYKSEAHTIMANIAYQIMPNWNITTDFSYTLGTGHISDLRFDSMYPTGDSKLDAIMMTSAGQNTLQPYLYDVAYINGIDEYSDLDYQQVDLSVGTHYVFDNGVGIGVNYYFTHFKDDDPYVYGDEGNTAQLLMGYLSYSF
jgi:hypothetical protein